MKTDSDRIFYIFQEPLKMLMFYVMLYLQAVELRACMSWYCRLWSFWCRLTLLIFGIIFTLHYRLKLPIKISDFRLGVSGVDLHYRFWVFWIVGILERLRPPPLTGFFGCFLFLFLDFWPKWLCLAKKIFWTVVNSVWSMCSFLNVKKG